MLFDDLVNKLPNDLINRLKSCMQSPRWHGEGSVFNHICLVSKALSEDVDMQICALFHDLGKLDTTRFIETKDGIKITSINHENYFEYYWLHYGNLFDSYVSNWYKIGDICKQHMLAHLYMNQKMSNPNKRKAFEELFYFNEIIQFAHADEEGRMEGINVPTVVVEIGVPGSGKTTWAKEFCTKSGYSRINPDEIREEITGSISDQTQNGLVWQTAFHRLKENIANNVNTVFDSTGCNVKTVKSLQTICKDKAIICYKFFKVDPQECKRRIKEDLTNKVNRSNVPEDVIDRMQNGFVEVVKYLQNPETLNHFLE